MEKLIIIDFLVQDVNIHIYTIKSDIEIDDSFIKKLGFDPNYCSWHFGNKAEVINHEEILE